MAEVIINQQGHSGMIDMSLNRFFGSDIPANEVNARKERIIDAINKTEYKITISGGMTIMGGGVATIAVNTEDKYPIICLVNGVGSIGKDTFEEAVGSQLSAYKFSSIDAVKEAAELLIMQSGDEIAIDEMNSKSDKYRSFLHDIKMAWVDYFDGPTNQISTKIQDLLTAQNNGAEAYDVIFIDIRETDEIAKTQKYLIETLGLICITILVKGWIDPATFSNEGDRNAHNHKYDLEIINTYGKKDIFQIQANIFGTVIKGMNQIYGIPSNQVNTEMLTEIKGMLDDDTANGTVSTQPEIPDETTNSDGVTVYRADVDDPMLQ